MPYKMEISEVYLSDFHRDASDVLVLLKLWFSKIREFLEMLAEKIKISSLREMKAKLEEQPVVVCFKNLAKFVAYVGGLWLESL